MKATTTSNNLPVIRAFNKCSEAGFNVFAPAIFVAKCNLRCPYCMNSKLVLNQVEEVIDIESVENYVKENNIDMLMISGGEPTAVPKMLDLLEEIKSWGCRIGMSTNGLLNEELFAIIPYLDYVALDAKGNHFAYEKAGGQYVDFLKLILSKYLLAKEMVLREEFTYEVRTTLYPLYVDETVMEHLGKLMDEGDVWVLQQFRHAKDMIDPSCKNIEPYSEEKIEELVRIAKRYTDNVHVRYV